MVSHLLGGRGIVLGGGHDTQIGFGAFLEVLSAIRGIGTAVERADPRVLDVLHGSGRAPRRHDRQSAPQGILAIPEIIREAFFGIYLVVKGFRPSSAILRDD